MSALRVRSRITIYNEIDESTDEIPESFFKQNEIEKHSAVVSPDRETVYPNSLATDHITKSNYLWYMHLPVLRRDAGAACFSGQRGVRVFHSRCL